MMSFEKDPFGIDDDLAPAREPMMVVDAADLVNTPYEPPRFVVRHLVIHEGLTLLTGDTGAGKTALLAHIAIAIALRAPVGQQFDVDPDAGPVLYLNGEMPAQVLTEYVQRAAAGFDRELPRQRVFFEGPTGVAEFRFDFDGCRRLNDLVAIIAPSVIIFDTQRALFDIDENDAGDVRRAFAFIRALCSRYQCAAIVAHHLRKLGAVSNSDRERVSGSRDIIAAVDVHLALRSRDGRPLHAIALGKTRSPIDGVSAGTEWPITASLSDDPPRSSIIAGDSTSRELIAEKIADAETALIERLDAEGPLTIDALGARTGNVKRAYEALRAAGSIVECGKDGRKTLYGLPEQRDQYHANGVNADPTRDPIREKPNKHGRLNGVNADPTRDPAGQIANEHASPPLADGDRLSLSSNEWGQGSNTIGTPDPDPTREKQGRNAGSSSSRSESAEFLARRSPVEDIE